MALIRRDRDRHRAAEQRGHILGFPPFHGDWEPPVHPEAVERDRRRQQRDAARDVNPLPFDAAQLRREEQLQFQRRRAIEVEMDARRAMEREWEMIYMGQGREARRRDEQTRKAKTEARAKEQKRQIQKEAVAANTSQPPAEHPQAEQVNA